MNAIESTSTRPYLIRALYEWCTDNGLTPYIAVLVDDSVQVPREYVTNGEIVLNISYDATSSLKLGNDFIEFKARFAGIARDIMVPVQRVLAIYARENGQGMAFPVGAQPEGQGRAVQPSPLSDVAPAGAEGAGAGAADSRGVMQLVPSDPPAGDGAQAPDATGGPGQPPTDPPRPPSGPRPALKRIK